MSPDVGFATENDGKVSMKMMTIKPARRGARNGRAVRLETYQPNAIDVCVAGSFNDWNPQATPMVPLGNGKWTKELTLPDGQYEYRFVVDGTWVSDPQAIQSAPNPFGSANSVLRVEAHS